MSESNPLIEAIRRLATMIAAKPDVSLGKVDPDSPAPSPQGVVLTVGRQRVALSAPTSDTGWQPLDLMEGFTGGVWYRLRDGEVRLHGRVIRAGGWPAASTPWATLPPAIIPAKPAASPYVVALAAVTGLGEPVWVGIAQSGLTTARPPTATSDAGLDLHLSWRVD